MGRGVTPSHPVARLSFPHHTASRSSCKTSIVRKGRGAALTERPGLSLAPHDFDAERDMLASEEREAARSGRRRLGRGEKKEGGDASSVTLDHIRVL